MQIAIKISLKVVPSPNGLIHNILAFGSDNSLAPAWRQAIIWTNDG